MVSKLCCGVCSIPVLHNGSELCAMKSLLARQNKELGFVLSVLTGFFFPSIRDLVIILFPSFLGLQFGHHISYSKDFVAFAELYIGCCIWCSI